MRLGCKLTSFSTTPHLENWIGASLAISQLFETLSCNRSVIIRKMQKAFFSARVHQHMEGSPASLPLACTLDSSSSRLSQVHGSWGLETSLHWALEASSASPSPRSEPAHRALWASLGTRLLCSSSAACLDVRQAAPLHRLAPSLDRFWRAPASRNHKSGPAWDCETSLISCLGEGGGAVNRSVGPTSGSAQQLAEITSQAPLAIILCKTIDIAARRMLPSAATWPVGWQSRKTCTLA